MARNLQILAQLIVIVVPMKLEISVSPFLHKETETHEITALAQYNTTN